MAALTGRVLRQSPNPEHIDFLFGALAISFLMHVIAISALHIISSLKEKPPVREQPVPYIVHLKDPGPLSTPSSSTKKIRRKKLITPKKTVPAEKSVGKPKKLVPIKKEMVIKKDKIKDSSLKKKKVASDIKKDKKILEEIQERKTGGIIDIRKFPYEWYLNIMRSRINSNWDTLKLNFFTDNTVQVRVYFQLDRSGTIKELRIEKSTGLEDIDRSALEAIRQSAPFPPLPPGYKEEFLEVHFGFELNPER